MSHETNIGKVLGLRKFLGAWLVIVLFFTSIIVTPTLSIDIFALPKTTFFVVNVCAVGLIVLFFRPLYLRISSDKVTRFIFLFTIFLLFVSISFQGLNEERLFGVHGRFNGVLTYAALFLMIIVLRSTFDEDLVKFTFLVGVAGNLLVGIYFLLQKGERDPLDWAIVYQDPSSTLGNPNFVSGFLATTTFCYLYIFSIRFSAKTLTIVSKISALSGIAFSIICISLTNSILGLVAVTVGFWFYFSPIAINKIVNGNLTELRKLFTFVITSISFFAAALIVIGRDLLDSRSVSNRLYYWKVSWDALLERPLQGYGFDTTGEFFRKIDRQDRFGPNFAVDSSHNLVLDFATWVGLPLTLILLVLLATLLLASVKGLFRSSLRISSLSILVPSVFAFLVQSLVSVPTIAINSWGFLFVGALLSALYPVSSKHPKSQLLSPQASLVRYLSVPLVIFLLILFPIRFAKDVEFRNFAEASDGLSLVNLVEDWPKDSYHYWTVVYSLYLSNQPELAREVGQRGLEHNPNNYLLMDEMYRADKDPEFKQNIARRMKNLNPLFLETP